MTLPWILWTAVPRADGKVDKLPVDWRNLAVADAHDRDIWTDQATVTATAAAAGGKYRPGVVITPGHWFLDIDHCKTPEGWSPIALELCARLPGAYAEISYSGEGIHIIGAGSPPPHASRNGALGLELYSRLRFCAVTGTNARGDMDADLTDAITTVAAAYFPRGPAGAEPAPIPDEGPCAEWSGPTDDEELLHRMLASQSAGSAFAGKATFRQLWEADGEALGRVFPDGGGQGREYDASAADAALLQRLAFWTGRDAARIDRLARRSALAREKWERGDYLPRTIRGVCARQREVYHGRTPKPAPAAAGGTADCPEGAQADPKKPTHMSHGPLPVFCGLQSDALVSFGGQLPSPRLSLLRAADVKSEPVRWLWPGYLARGKLHVLAGPAGTGKTTLALAMAATITRGALWPDGSRAASGAVLVWSGEDGIADSLKPRLEANGADTERVYFIHGVEHGERKRPFDPAMDMPHLREAARRVGNVALLIVDPVVSAVAGDSHKNAEVRRGLQPLVDLAADIGCAAVGVTHFTKGTQGRDPTERVTGSLAFGAFARVVMCTAKSAAPGMSRRLVRSKSNIGPDGGGFEYDLEQVCIQHGPPDVFGQRIVWGAQITGAAVDLLGQVETPATAPGNAPALDAAATFLREVLANSPTPVAELKEDARGAGVSWSTVKRAKLQLGVHTTKAAMGGGWVWHLPAEGDQGNAL